MSQTALDIIINAVDNASAKIGGIGDALGKVGAIAGGAAVAGIGLATAAVVGSVNAFNDWAGTLDSLGDVLGTTADESAALVVAIEGVGGNTEAITGQMAKLTQGLFNAKGELGPSGELLTKLGIAFQDTNGKMLSSSDIIKNVADKISQMPDGLEKSEAMMQLFGKSGKDMTDTLSALTTEGLDKATAKAKEYGLAIGDNGVNASVEAGKAGKEFELMLKGIAVQIGSQVLPALLPLAETILGLARTALPPVLTALKQFGEFVGALLAQINTFVNSAEFISFMNDAKVAIEGAFKAGAAIAERVWPIIERIVNLIGEIFKTVFETIFEDQTQMQADTEEIWKAIETAITIVLTAIETALRVALALFKGLFKGDWSAMQKIVADAMAAIKGAVDAEMAKVKLAIETEFNNIIKFMESLPSQFLRFGTAIIEGIAQGIRDGAGAVRNALTDFLRRTLPGWAIELLGIGSPSRVFADIGKQIPAGLAVGILAGQDQVLAALNQMFAGAAGFSIGAALGRSAGASFTFADQISVTGGVNTARAIADARREATRQAMLRMAVVGG